MRSLSCLTHGLSNRNLATQRANRYLCEKHLLPQLGRRKIRDLSASEVDAWLSALALVLSTRTVQGVRPAWIEPWIERWQGIWSEETSLN